jgi:hypothetical protein
VTSALIRYVDGTELAVTLDAWPDVRGDGVDYFDIDGHRFQGFTLYWLYPDGDNWVAGGYGPDPPLELLFSPSGDVVTTRRPAYPPDLAHGQVKVGWWLPDDGGGDG